MSKRVQWVGHITSQANEFAGREREITVDISTNELRVHDGSTPGGHRILTLAQLEALFQPFGNSDFESIQVDTISEHTGNSGVTIDGVLVKDGNVDGVDVSTLSSTVTTIGNTLVTLGNDFDAHEANVSNPHAVTKAQVGLGNVTNEAQLSIADLLSEIAAAGGAAQSTARGNLGLGALAVLSAVNAATITDDSITNAEIKSDAAIVLSKLAAQAAGTIVGNFTAGSAVPTAKANQYGLDFGTTGPKLAIQAALFQDQKSSGTAGGSSVADTWTKRTCDDQVFNGITGLSQASSVFTLGAAGTYIIIGISPFFFTNGTTSRIRRTNNTAATLAVGSPTDQGGAAVMMNSIALCVYTTAVTTDTIELQYFSADARATDGLGSATTNGDLEVYGQMLFIRIA